MRKIILIVMILSTLFITGCSSNNINTEEGNYDFSLTMKIEKYSLVMSSVPGLPLAIKCNNHDSKEKLELQFLCDEGEFLIWNDDGSISRLTSDYSCEFEDLDLYWSPINDESEITTEDIILTVLIKEENTGKLLEEKKYTIEEKDNYYYLNDK